MKKTKIRLFIGLISFVLYSFFIYAPIFPSISNNLWDELFTGTKPSLEKLINDYDKNPSKEYQKSDILKIIGIAWHNLGHLGQTGAGEKSFKYLEKASKLMSDDMEILAYMGSAETLKARDDWFPISKLMGVNSGASKIDKAIENDPDNVIVRLVRANNSLALPSFFNREKYAKEDLLYLEKANDNANLNIPPDTLSNIYLMLGKIFRKEEGKLQDAIVYFEKSAHVAPDSTYGKEAREMVVLLSD